MKLIGNLFIYIIFRMSQIKIYSKGIGYWGKTFDKIFTYYVNIRKQFISVISSQGILLYNNHFFKYEVRAEKSISKTFKI